MKEVLLAISDEAKEKLFDDIEAAARFNEEEFGSTVRVVLYTLHK